LWQSPGKQADRLDGPKELTLVRQRQVYAILVSSSGLTTTPAERGRMDRSSNDDDQSPAPAVQNAIVRLAVWLFYSRARHQQPRMSRLVCWGC
jgi:hypothetical protein